MMFLKIEDHKLRPVTRHGTAQQRTIRQLTASTAVFMLLAIALTAAFAYEHLTNNRAEATLTATIVELEEYATLLTEAHELEIEIAQTYVDSLEAELEEQR